MRIPRVLVVASVASAVVVAAALGLRAYRARLAPLGPIRATPAAASVSVRVGDTLRFSAAAEHAIGFTWSVWGRRVASRATWSYVPGPEDAGWQRVTVEARGRGGRRIARAWDVGVVPAVAPDLAELTPPAGRLAVAAGEPSTFRCAARLAGARPADQLTFEWTVDGRVALFERQPAADAASELTVPAPEPGAHRVRVTVTEDGRTASLADWVVDVAPPAPVEEAAVAPPPPPEPPPAAALVPPEPAPPLRLVLAPDPGRLDVDVGDATRFEARVEPERAGASYRWTVDGRPPARSRGAALEYRPATAGRHRVAVTAEADGRVVGREAWTVIARAPELEPPVKEPVAPPPTEPPPQATPPPPPPSLAEADVRSWLAEYARAWSRKDSAALRRMGQVRTAADAARLDRYFESIGELEVDVHLLALHVAGDRASVQFERTDTVRDRLGIRHQFRLPPAERTIERTPTGLRFADDDHG